MTILRVRVSEKRLRAKCCKSFARWKVFSREIFCSGRLIILPTYCDYYCNNRHDVMSSWINSIVTGYPPNRCIGRLSKYL